MARAELETLRRFALGLPGAEESVACAGTVIEKRTVKAGGKAFLFLGSKDLMLKLGKSLAQARKLAHDDPERCKAGTGGWVSIRFESGLPLPVARLRAWVAESHAILSITRAAGSGKSASTRRSRRAST
jgi:hypothetical protein